MNVAGQLKASLNMGMLSGNLSAKAEFESVSLYLRFSELDQKVPFCLARRKSPSRARKGTRGVSVCIRHIVGAKTCAMRRQLATTLHDSKKPHAEFPQ